MVLKPCFYACVLVVLASIATAEPPGHCPQLQFTSHDLDKSYGVYLVAPAKGCAVARYLISGAGVRVMSRPLRPGQAQMLHLGAGFAPGSHHLRLRSLGCAQAPALLRRVVMRKASPDHGARALTYIEAHALGEWQG